MLTFTPNKIHELKLQLEIFLHLFDNYGEMGTLTHWGNGHSHTLLVRVKWVESP